MSKLSGFLELLKAPLKILSQNGKLVALIATFYLMPYSIAFILYMLSAKPFFLDLILKLIALASAHPGTPDFTTLLVAISEDAGIFLGIEAAFAVLFFFIALFAQTTLIIIASCYYNGYVLSLKVLLVRVSKVWTRPFVTSLLVHLFALGYTSFFLLPFLVPSLVLFDHRLTLIAVLIFIAIPFITFYIYLSVVWSLAVVVSVVEDSSGFLALEKAKELMKGKRVNGFLLNLLCIFVTLVIVITGTKLSSSMPIVVGVIQTVLLGILGMFKFMAYSGLYFHCENDLKKSRGFEYSRMQTTPLLDEYLP